MSLIRLLSAGRSLVPLRQEGRRYRAAKQGMLPTFGPLRPNAPAAEVKAAKTDLLSPPVKAAAVQSPVRLSEMPVAPAGAMAGTKSGWFNPFARRGARRAPVQTEMALENVRVMRNDLSDADWEWQRAEGGAERAGGGFAQKAGNLWRRLAGRWSGGARTQNATS